MIGVIYDLSFYKSLSFLSQLPQTFTASVRSEFISQRHIVGELGRPRALALTAIRDDPACVLGGSHEGGAILVDHLLVVLDEEEGWRVPSLGFLAVLG